MTRALEFHPAAAEDLLAASVYYATIRASLGAAFVDRVEVAVSRAWQAPLTGSPVSANLRRIFVRRFPYSVIFAVEDARIFIVAVAHFRRRVGFWRERI